MNSKGVGAVFCLIAAILLAAKYLSAAILMSGGPSHSRELYLLGLDFVGPPLSIAAAAALAAGLLFLVWGLVRDARSGGKK